MNQLPPDILNDIEIINRISAVTNILDVVCRSTGMSFAAVARVTSERWVVCAVKDDIHFGLLPGGELKVNTTICHEIRQHQNAVVIDHVAKDKKYACHPTPQMYGFQSYISVPIYLKNGDFWGDTLRHRPKPGGANQIGRFGDVYFIYPTDFISYQRHGRIDISPEKPY